MVFFVSRQGQQRQQRLLGSLSRRSCCTSFILLVALFCSTKHLVSSFSNNFIHSPRQSIFQTRKRIMSNTQCLATLTTTPTTPSSSSITTTTTTSTCQTLTQHLTNDEMWNEYRTLMQDIMTRDRVVKKTKPEMLTQVQEYLLDRTTLNEEYDMCNLPEQGDDEDIVDNVDDKKDNSTATTTITNNSNKNAMNQFRVISREHYAAFCDAKGFNDKAQTDYLERCLGYTADWCAKKKLVVPAAIAWRKLRQTGFVPRENTVSTFLFVFSLLPDNEVANAALDDVATFHDACFEPNEKTVFLRIKSLLKSDETQQAENLLLYAIPQHLQRLRTFTPLLVHYCTQGTVDGAAHGLRLFRHMRNAPGVHLDVETYVLLLSSLAQQGLFGSIPAVDNTSSAMMQQAGFAVTGPALLDALAMEMGQDLLELNETAAVNLYQSLQTAFAPAKKDDNKNAVTSSLPLATTWTSSAGEEINMGRVTIDPTTCLCPATKAKLQLFSLTTDQRTMVHETLLQMASTQHLDFAAKMKQRSKRRQEPESSSGAYALEQLSTFVDWVAQRNFTAIIDGPNIAYFGHPVLHYSQVARMVDHLERLGERPLVTMPFKYCQPSFYVATIGKEQNLSERDLQVIADLKEKDQFYAVPEWCLDDYYWMIASVVAQVSVTDDNVSLPGLRPLLITNDQMRDHRMDLLEPRLFRRWTSCHVVRYKFGPYDGNEWQADRHVFLEHADSFSREIQGNPITTSNGAAATAWHIPIAEWNEDDHNDRFCISIAAPP